MKRFAILTTLLIVLSLALIACSGGAAQPDASGYITIELDEYGFSPNHIELRAGQTVTIHLKNKGELEHEFMVGRNVVLTDEGLPNGFEVDFFGSASPEVVGGTVMGLEDMADMSMGRWVMNPWLKAKVIWRWAMSR